MSDVDELLDRLPPELAELVRQGFKPSHKRNRWYLQKWKDGKVVSKLVPKEYDKVMEALKGMEKEEELKKTEQFIRKTKEELDEVESRLARYGIVEPDHPLVQQVREVKKSLESSQKALIQAYQELGVQPPFIPLQPGQPPPGQPAGQPPGPAERGGTLERLAESVEELEKEREKARELLEKAGFRVEDRYIPREEVERMLEEERRKAVEEALDDRRIKAFENIVQHAVNRVADMFQPLIQVWADTLIERRGRPSTRGERSGSRPSSASES